MKTLFINSNRIIFLAVCLLISTIYCKAQGNVSLLNGSNYLSEAAITEASTRLSTELSSHDVRISYISNYTIVSDRYTVYETTDLMSFTQIPNNSGGFVPATEEQKTTAINAAIHEAITTGGGDENTIHIIYALAISLDAEGDEALDSRKYFHFGNAVSRLDQMKVEQITPDPELEVLNDVSQNDQYLADYVEELILALNDPDYVVTGTIRYLDGIYADGDTIYIVKETEEQYFPMPHLHLQINTNYAEGIGTILWIEPNPTNSNNSMLFYNSMFTNELVLDILGDHFKGVNEIVANFGSEHTTVHIFPVNLNLSIDPEVLEKRQDSDHLITIDIYNDEFLFENRPGLKLKAGIAYGGLGFNQVLNEADPPIVTWNTQSYCSDAEIYVTAFAGDQLLCTVFGEVRLKCPKPFEINARIPSMEDSNNNRIVREGENLYIIDVNFGNTESRNVVGYLTPAEENDNYWEGEPLWSTSAIFDEILPIDYQGRTHVFKFNEDHFPSINAFPFGGNPEEEYSISVSAFDEEKSLNIITFTENRKIDNLATLGGGYGAIANMLPKVEEWVNHLKSKINNSGFLGAVLPSFSADVSSSLSLETYNKEDPDSRFYHNYLEHKFEGHLGISTSGADINDEWWIPGMHYDFLFGEAGVYFKANLEFNPHLDFVSRRYSFNAEYEYYRTEFVLALQSEVGLGAKLVVLPGFTYGQAAASGYAAMRITLEGSYNVFSDELNQEDNFELTAYIDPFNFTFQIYLDVMGYELVNYDETWHFFDRVELGPAVFIFDENN